jgi:DNA polymerase-3 subunit gamma/tau
LAQRFAPDEVQLYYQIALHGRNDMHLAPDEYAGFTMTLLRMLAFAPDVAAGETAPLRAAALVATKPPRATVPAPVAKATTPTTATSPASAAASRMPPALPEAAAATVPAFDGDWPGLVERLPVQGLPRQLAAVAQLVGQEGDVFRLRVPNRTLAEAGTIERLKAGLSQHFGRPVRLTVEVGATSGPTAAGIAELARAERQKRAEDAIYGDPFVQQMIESFGAEIDPNSIRPIEP